MADEDRERQAYECFNAPFDGAAYYEKTLQIGRDVGVDEHVIRAALADIGLVYPRPFGVAVEVDERMAAILAAEAEAFNPNRRTGLQPMPPLVAEQMAAQFAQEAHDLPWRWVNGEDRPMFDIKDEDDLDLVLSYEMEHAPRSYEQTPMTPEECWAYWTDRKL